MSKIKKNFTSILSKPDIDTPTIFMENKHPSNFDSFVVEHCEGTVRNKLDILSKNNVSENGLNSVRQGMWFFQSISI